jgi:hypothetical protein
MFNPVILAAIFIQWIVSRYSRKTSAIIGYIITTGILVWGLFIYSAGDEIAFLGFTLSLPVFIIACLVWYGLDTVEFMSVREREARLKAVKTNQPAGNPNSNIGTPGSPEQEQLTYPCKVIFYRDKSMLGALAPQIVNLNGREISEIHNGKSIEFTTNKKSNAIVVTDRTGGVSKPYPFDAVEGGRIEIHFKLGNFSRPLA